MTADPFTPAPFEEGDDPFALPLFDPDTGELLEDEAPVAAPAPPAAVDVVVGSVLDRVEDAGFVAALRDGLVARLDHDTAMLVAQRPPGRVTEAVVAPEVRFLAAAEGRLSQIAAAFTAAARYAKDALGDVVLDVRRRDVTITGGSASVKVGEAGGDVKVTLTQPTRTVVDEAAVLDVITGQVAAEAPDHEPVAAVIAAQAARAALERYRSLVSPPAWKSTALDLWRRELEAAGDPAATKLAAAVGRVPYGSPQVKIDRTPEKEPS